MKRIGFTKAPTFTTAISVAAIFAIGKEITVKKMIAGTVGAVAVLAAVTACGGGGPASPPSAASILVSNGYTPDPVMQAAAQVLGSNSGVTSSAAGENANTSVQIVWVFSSSALAAAGVSTLGGSGGGITVGQNGDVVTATGSESAWAAQGAAQG